MTSFICTACGTGFPDSDAPPPSCAICVDERQYVPAAGQAWTTHEALAATHVNAWRQPEPGLLSLHTRPAFGIDQRAFLLSTQDGNILWDCITLLDAATERIVRSLGGVAAIAISHPHYYTRMGAWAEAFGAPIHLHAADRAWVMRPDPAIRFFEGDTAAILPGVTMVRLGGHFPGGSALHWAGGADGRGVLLSGDIVQVAADTRRVSFLWSYPNMMPLSAAAVRRLAARLDPWRFDRIYGAFVGKDVMSDAKAVVASSCARYCALLEGAED